MTMIGAAVTDFGDEIGLPLEDLPEGAHIALSIEGTGQVHFEHRNEQLVIYTARGLDVALDRYEVYKTALRAIHFERRLPVRVQCALHDDALVFATRFDEDEVDPQAIELAIVTLADLQQQVRAQ